jgi:hypothetical protein
MDKYYWLQVIGLAALLSPAAMLIEAGDLSWHVAELFREHVEDPS